MFDYLKQEIKIMILNGYYNARYAYSEINSKRQDNSIIIGHLSIANSHINSARSVYVCNNNEFVRPEFDDFFHEFSAFSDEVLTNIRTDHSHQWSDIHYNRLEEKYQIIAPLLGIKQFTDIST